MGVNMVGFAITDDEAAVEASKQEIIRRYYQTVLDLKPKSWRSCCQENRVAYEASVSHQQTVRLLLLHVKKQKKLVDQP